MNQLLLPTSDEFVEHVARAIAKDRLYRDASLAMNKQLGVDISDNTLVEAAFDRIFEQLWAGTSVNDLQQKEFYRGDAKAAISAINLRLLTSGD
jgi:hypothetical protein